MEARKNINRGFKNLRVWKDAVDLYCITYEILSKLPYDLNRVKSNAIDAVHSISRNIAEGYCRRGINEYLNFLNIALGSCGEFHSSYCSFFQAGQISEEDYKKIDLLHYKVENQLIKLIKSLQVKQRNGEWETKFIENCE